MATEEVLEVLRGRTRTSNALPAPKQVKVFICCDKAEFAEERRMLLEQVGPDLQTQYDNSGFEIELVDMHYGSADTCDPLLDPHMFDDHLEDIRDSHAVNQLCFLLVLVGDEARPAPPPVLLDQQLYRELEAAAEEQQPASRADTAEFQRFMAVLRTGAERLAAGKASSEAVREQAAILLQSGLLRQLLFALSLDPAASKGIMSISRQSVVGASAQPLCQALADQLPQENRGSVKPPASGNHDDEAYSDSFQLQARLVVGGGMRRAISARVEPSVKNKSVMQRLQAQHVSKERHAPLLVVGPTGAGKSTLLSAVYRQAEDWLGAPLNRIVRLCGATPRASYSLELVRLLCQQFAVLTKQSIITKDASLEQPYVQAWFERLSKRIEESGETMLVLLDDLPRINPLDQEQGPAALSWLPMQLPRNILLVATSTAGPDTLRLTATQKERLRAADCVIRLAAAQEPSLEQQVEQELTRMEKAWGRVAVGRLAGYLACTEYGLSETELLELLMPTAQSSPAPLLLEHGHFNFSTFCRVRRSLGSLIQSKVMSGKVLLTWRHHAIRQWCKKRYLGDRDALPSAHAAIASLFFSEFIAEGDIADLAQGDEALLPLASRRSSTPQAAQEDPLDREIIKEEEEEEEDDFSGNLIREEEEDDEAVQQKKSDDEDSASDQDSQDAPCDVSYSPRHVEEAWLHLLGAGDHVHLLRHTVCSFDFLLAAVQTVSVGYLRCVLEHARCFLLDRALELVYYTLRKAGDVLVRDPLQLAAQLVCWLRPAQEQPKDRDSLPQPLPDLVSRLLSASMAWCDGFHGPLLVPLTGWLQAPLPLQIRSMVCTHSVRLVEPTPCGQHVIVVPNGVPIDPQMWHIMSNALVTTFKGHSAPVTCMHTTPTQLITGSVDLHVIVWSLKTYEILTKIHEHIAAVLCITPALGGSVVVSGGEDSSIVVANMTTGRRVMKVDHHRGPVTALKINAFGDVLVSGSTDQTVCLWALDSCQLLNTINVATGVSLIGLSPDSVFLLIVLDNNQLVLHSTATGTEIHALRGHRAKARSLCLAADNRRAVLGGEDGKVYVFDLHSGWLERTLDTHTNAVTGVCCTERDDFLLTAGGNVVTLWSFRRDEASAAAGVAGMPGVAEVAVSLGPVAARHARKMSRNSQVHTAPITCMEVCRDGTTAVTGSVDSLVNIWLLNPPELHATLEGHIASVTAVSFAPNGLFCISGSEDKTVRVWGLTLGQCVATFKGHQNAVTSVCVLADSRRVVSGDRAGLLAVWVADDASLLQTCNGPGSSLAVTHDMKFVVSGVDDTSLRIWSLTREDERFSVSHSQEVTCLALSSDSLHLITGSRDTSLKVWQLAGGKLAQVLVGHTDDVTCVSVSVTNKSLVVSGSKDANLICWDINTGNDVQTLSGHLGCVTCVRVSGDGTLVVSGSEDRTIMVWDVNKGTPLTALVLHQPILGLAMASDASRIGVQLLDSRSMLIVFLHNTPATYVTLPAYVAPKEMEDLRPPLPKRAGRRLLKKEVSLDTYTWQKKYGQLTSSIMMAAVDERLKRRFSVSASMEEISKCKAAAPSSGMPGPEQAALAQSQHFDQLEALWNQRSPPQRRKNQLKKQTSLSSCRDILDQDTDITYEEGD
ncbi:uncharacterized protein LOC117651170 [Thrips palmi]|uniref:Uncharacterized protein LOC117651170 n=1 Tax=Thrips palmi TaxID=161013 RepID=A0A6P8ZZK5_THRPL|nr:uncharacterized protein LOC117651170 [Thrips palmi]